jgi:anti-sigma regulatory factor (Ser/Thr protein kinase)
MSEINITCSSNYSESRLWVIWDKGIDPNAPRQIFSGYLDPDGVTGPLGVYSADGIYGSIVYKRSDGPTEVVDDVTDGSQIAMD